MDKFKILLMVLFFYSGAVFGWIQSEDSSRIAAETAQPDTGPQGTDKQVEENRTDIVDAARAAAEVKDKVSDIQQDVNRIDRTAQTQEFILKALTIIMPLGLALVGWLQVRSTRAAEKRDVRRHADMQSLEKSIDGVQTKVVAVATAAGFEEGAAINTNTPAGKQAYAERSTELKEDVRVAKVEQKEASAQAKEDMKDNGDA